MTGNWPTSCFPQHNVAKTYEAVVTGKVTEQDIRRFEEGVTSRTAIQPGQPNWKSWQQTMIKSVHSYM